MSVAEPEVTRSYTDKTEGREFPTPEGGAPPQTVESDPYRDKDCFTDLADKEDERQDW